MMRINPQIANEWFRQGDALLNTSFGGKPSVPAGFLRQIAVIENSYNPVTGDYTGKRSSAGARGLMQLMPVSLRDIKQAFGADINPDNPTEAIMGAALLFLRKHQLFMRKYKRAPSLAQLVIAYNSSLSGAAKYTGSLASVAREETRRYLEKMRAGGVAV